MPAQDLIIDLAIRYGFQVVGALVILFAGLLAAWWVGNVVERPLTRMALEPPMRRLMVRVVRVVVLLFALVIALDKFGFQIAPLVAGLRGAGLRLRLPLPGVPSHGGARWAGGRGGVRGGGRVYAAVGGAVGPRRRRSPAAAERDQAL